MTMHKLTGACHCGNIELEVELSDAPEEYDPRACDCEFCTKHGASYVSDPRGSLVIRVADGRRLQRYRQGSGIADFLICANCGVLTGVVYQESGQNYATVNSRVIDDRSRFGEVKAASPKLLSAGEKTERWKTLWFSNVAIEAADGGDRDAPDGNPAEDRT